MFAGTLAEIPTFWLEKVGKLIGIGYFPLE